MTLRSKLLARFRDRGYRQAYVDSFLDAYIATQIKVLREQRELSQTELAEKARMKQSQISPMEDVNHTSWKISTLKKIAKAFDLVLVVRFESFGAVLPDIERFARESLERPSFDADAVFFDIGASVVVQSVSSAHPAAIQAASIGCRVFQFSHVRHGVVGSAGTSGSPVQSGIDSMTSVGAGVLERTAA
jgi:transcriptional regulator with XRE-family HTH domain